MLGLRHGKLMHAFSHVINHLLQAVFAQVLELAHSATPNMQSMLSQYVSSAAHGASPSGASESSSVLSNSEAGLIFQLSATHSPFKPLMLPALRDGQLMLVPRTSRYLQ